LLPFCRICGAKIRAARRRCYRPWECVGGEELGRVAWYVCVQKVVVSD
jgi:hypothetical protein